MESLVLMEQLVQLVRQVQQDQLVLMEMAT
jgi:hypothetical protein